VFAFTFAIVQPVLGGGRFVRQGAVDDWCLVLLAGDISRRNVVVVSLLFVTPDSRRIGSGRVFDRAEPTQRSGRSGKTAGRDRSNPAGSHDRHSPRRLSLRVIGDLLGWRGVLAVLGILAVVASAR